MSPFTLRTALPALLVSNSRRSALVHRLVRPLLFLDGVKANHLKQQTPPRSNQIYIQTMTKQPNKRRCTTYLNARFSRRSPPCFNCPDFIPAACFCEKGSDSTQRTIPTAMEGKEAMAQVGVS